MPKGMRDRVDIAVAFGRVVRNHRTRKNWTVEELAFGIEVDPGALSQLERGERTPTLTDWMLLANALDLPPSQLLTDFLQELQTLPVAWRKASA